MASDIEITFNLIAAIAAIASTLGIAFTYRRELEQILQKAVLKLHIPIFGSTNPAPGTARPCPNNPAHLLDPNWAVCPYCKAEQEARQKSVRPAVVAAASRRERTAVGEVFPAGERRETKVMPPAGAARAGGEPGEGDTRRIVGLLISYTWRSEGQLFPIREGKNFIGRDQISSEAEHRSCDIQVGQDGKMSGEHALILCRQGHYELIDQMSSNGTFLNGQLLRANQATELPNYAGVLTGETAWTFLKIDAPLAAEPLSRKDDDKTSEDPPEDGRFVR